MLKIAFIGVIINNKTPKSSKNNQDSMRYQENEEGQKGSKVVTEVSKEHSCDYKWGPNNSVHIGANLMSIESVDSIHDMRQHKYHYLRAGTLHRHDNNKTS